MDLIKQAGRMSPRLKKHLQLIAQEAPGPIVDAPCGNGRNAIPFAQLGRRVLCVDLDPRRLQTISELRALGLFLEPHTLDLLQDPLAIGEQIGALINVHFLDPSLISRFSPWLAQGAFVYIESYEDRGENFLQLPAPGEYRRILSDFQILEYAERPAVKSSGSVVFHVLARKGTP